MELWIRSQDRETLKQAYHLDIYSLLDSEIDKCWYIEESGTDLGVYNSKERALEVLDEIQNILKPKMILKSNGGAYTLGDNNLHIVNPTYETIEQLDTYVYEMPEE